MSIIKNKHFPEGAVPNAADLNAVYDTLATDSVQAINTAKKWATRDHLNPAATKLNHIWWDDYPEGGTIFSTNSATLVTITNDPGQPTEVLPNYTAQNVILLRVLATGNVTDNIITTFGDGGGGQTYFDLYQFVIKVTYNTVSTTEMCYGNYSFTNLAGVRITNPPAVNFLNKPINWRNFSIGGIRTFPAGTVINKVELQCKVGNTGNTLKIGRNNLSVIIAEN